MDKVSKDDTYEVSDSTDWLETPLRSLTDVDSALRCQVCRDFYITPMITSCSHTFCSLCIRRSLNNDGKCPACRAPEQELRLRNNNVMEDLVEAFKRARPQVLAFARAPANVLSSSSSKRSLEVAEEEVQDSSPRKRRRSERTRSSSQRVPVEDDPDEDYNPEDGYVKCPVCERQVKEATINKHLDDDCMDVPQVTKSLGGRSGRGPAKSPTPVSDKPVKRLERLPQLHYSTIKDNALKKKLTDAGLSAAGNRPLLERRYTEWITLWNANCDATKPKSKAELKRELDVWERTQGGRATATSSTQMGAQIRDKDFNGKAWSTRHKDEFQELIANAKKKREMKAQSQPQSADSTTTSAESGVTTALAPSATTPDVVMAENEVDELILIKDSPVKPASQTRFFDENNSDAPPSSQFQSKLDILDKDAGLASDITTIRTLQP